MADVKLTPAQRRTAEEIGEGKVSWSRLLLKWASHEFPSSVRTDVVQRLVDAGIAKKGARINEYRFECVLTDLGREVIANG